MNNYKIKVLSLNILVLGLAALALTAVFGWRTPSAIATGATDCAAIGGAWNSATASCDTGAGSAANSNFATCEQYGGTYGANGCVFSQTTASAGASATASPTDPYTANYCKTDPMNDCVNNVFQGAKCVDDCGCASGYACGPSGTCLPSLHSSCVNATHPAINQNLTTQTGTSDACANYPGANKQCLTEYANCLTGKVSCPPASDWNPFLKLDPQYQGTCTGDVHVTFASAQDCANKAQAQGRALGLAISCGVYGVPAGTLPAPSAAAYTPSGLYNPECSVNGGPINNGAELLAGWAGTGLTAWNGLSGTVTTSTTAVQSINSGWWMLLPSASGSTAGTGTGTGTGSTSGIGTGTGSATSAGTSNSAAEQQIQQLLALVASLQAQLNQILAHGTGGPTVTGSGNAAPSSTAGVAANTFASVKRGYVLDANGADWAASLSDPVSITQLSLRLNLNGIVPSGYGPYALAVWCNSTSTAMTDANADEKSSATYSGQPFVTWLSACSYPSPGNYSLRVLAGSPAINSSAQQAVIPITIGNPSAANSSGVTFPVTVTVTAQTLNVRSAPHVTASLAGSQTLKAGNAFTATNEVPGDTVEGSNLWWVTSAGNYVWAGGTMVK